MDPKPISIESWSAAAPVGMDSPEEFKPESPSSEDVLPVTLPKPQVEEDLPLEENLLLKSPPLNEQTKEENQAMETFDTICCKGIFCCNSDYHNLIVASTVVVAVLMFLLIFLKVAKLLCGRSSSNRIWLK